MASLRLHRDASVHAPANRRDCESGVKSTGHVFAAAFSGRVYLYTGCARRSSSTSCAAGGSARNRKTAVLRTCRQSTARCGRSTSTNRKHPPPGPRPQTHAVASHEGAGPTSTASATRGSCNTSARLRPTTPFPTSFPPPPMSLANTASGSACSCCAAGRTRTSSSTQEGSRCRECLGTRFHRTYKTKEHDRPFPYDQAAEGGVLSEQP